MKSKILENQVRSGQLSSCQFFVVGGTSPPLVWRGRGTQRHSRMCPPLNGRSPHLIEAAKRGRLDQMIFFSAPLTTRAPPGRPAGRPAERPAGRPLTTRAPPTTVRPDVRPNVRLNARPNVSRLKRKPEKYIEKYFEQTLGYSIKENA